MTTFVKLLDEKNAELLETALNNNKIKFEYDIIDDIHEFKLEMIEYIKTEALIVKYDIQCLLFKISSY